MVAENIEGIFEEGARSKEIVAVSEWGDCLQLDLRYLSKSGVIGDCM